VNQEQLQLKYIPIASELFWDDNPNTHDLGQLAESIETYGFRNPPIWDNTLNDGKGGIVGGNGRNQVLLYMKSQGRKPPRCIVEKDGEWLMPVIFGCDAESEAQAIAFAIDDNNTVLGGGTFTAVDMANNWDKEKYLQVLQGLAERDRMPVTVDRDDLALMLSLATPKEVLAPEEEQEQTDEDIEKAEKGEFESRVQLGDIWQLGRHFLCCGDSTDPSNIHLFLGDRHSKVSFVWSDPPYGIKASHEGRTGYGGKKGKWGQKADPGEYEPIINDESEDTALNAFSACQSFTKAIQVWWGANFFPSVLPIAKSWIVWDKETYAPKFAEAELAWCNCNHPIRIVRHQWAGMIRASEHGEKRVHPTQKPVALAQRIFESHGKPNDFIFDPFLGSGMSIMAAEQMEGDRTVFGFELSPIYCTIILDRFLRLTGIEAIKTGTL
jgi:DNA modification methylase